MGSARSVVPEPPCLLLRPDSFFYRRYGARADIRTIALRTAQRVARDHATNRRASAPMIAPPITPLAMIGA